MAVQPTLSLSPDYLARLIVKIRGLQAREPEVDPNPASNAIDDRMVDSLQDTRGRPFPRRSARRVAGLE